MEKFTLLEGDEKIRVGNNTWAEIVLEDDSKVKAYSNTELFLKKIEEKLPGGTRLKKFALSIFSGKIMSSVKGLSKVYVNTSGCVARVEGVVLVRVTDGTTLIAVLNGISKVTDSESKYTVVLPPGHQVTVSPQMQLPKPTKIEDELLNELNMGEREIEKIESFEQARRKMLQSLPFHHPLVIKEKFKSEMAKPEWQKVMRKIEGIKKNVGKSVDYHSIEFNIATAEIRKEYKNRRGSENKAFLILKIGAKNNSSEQIFVFYQEEVRLISEAGKTIPLEDYKMETSFDPKAERDGYLLFVIPEENTKFKLQFGKKSLPKVELELDLVEKGKRDV